MIEPNPRAARIQLRGLVAAVVLAIIIAAGITAGAFVLSFSVLTDLARQAGIPADLAFLFPLIVDGAILGATIAAVALSKISGAARGKTFFIWLLIAVVLISVAGNAYHAWSTAEAVARNAATAATALAPLPAALIAVIPPALILAFTHGLGILIKAIGGAYREAEAAAAGQLDNAAPTAVAPGRAPVFVPVADAVAEVVPVADAVAVPVADAVAVPVADAVAEVVPVAVPVADAVAPVAVPVASQTVASLLEFFANSTLSAEVKETARLRVENPHWSFARLAEKTNAAAASTAMRRYKKAEAAAIEAGFTAPPLPEMDTLTNESEADELVSA